jgi:hypothetical protein
VAPFTQVTELHAPLASAVLANTESNNTVLTMVKGSAVTNLNKPNT